jgi:hypothetical protein
MIPVKELYELNQAHYFTGFSCNRAVERTFIFLVVEKGLNTLQEQV